MLICQVLENQVWVHSVQMSVRIKPVSDGPKPFSICSLRSKMEQTAAAASISCKNHCNSSACFCVPLRLLACPF